MKEVQKKKQKGQGISLKVKGLLLTGVMIFTVIGLTLKFTAPQIEGNMKKIVHSYMYDVAITNGKILDLEISNQGESVGLSENTLRSLFKDVNVHDMKSSYAYVVSKDGTMLFHPNAEKIGKPVENAVVKEVVGEISKGEIPESAVATYEFKGERISRGQYKSSTDVILNADINAALNILKKANITDINHLMTSEIKQPKRIKVS